MLQRHRRWRRFRPEHRSRGLGEPSSVDAEQHLGQQTGKPLLERH